MLCIPACRWSDLQTLHLQLGVVGCGSKKFGVDPDAPRERRRMAMTLNIGDPAVEWLRPLPPDLKMIGPILPEPARPLPADLEVCTPFKCEHSDK